MIARAAHLVWRITYARYVMASALALAADLTLFLMLLDAGADPMQAASSG